jgi:hypothetical protein
MIMKKVIGIAAFVLVFSIPAHGQTSKGGGIGVGSSGSPNANGGGGGMAGGLNGSGGRLPSYAAANLGAVAISGAGDPSFAPSTFLTFEQAVAEGKAESANQKTLAQIAAENSTTPKARAKFAFVQDANGKVVATTKQ